MAEHFCLGIAVASQGFIHNIAKELITSTCRLGFYEMRSSKGEAVCHYISVIFKLSFSIFNFKTTADVLVVFWLQTCKSV